MNEPNFQIGFYSKATKRPAVVEFDSINGIPKNQLGEDLGKRTSTFRLPLSAHSDTSRYRLSFTEYSMDIADTISYTEILVATYRRYPEESMGGVKIAADSFNIHSHSFDSLAHNIDPLMRSSDAVIKVYF